MSGIAEPGKESEPGIRRRRRRHRRRRGGKRALFVLAAMGFIAVIMLTFIVTEVIALR